MAEFVDNILEDRMRKRKGSQINGWLILDKPPGMTSNRALTIVKRLFDARKAGHSGTLDPLATGVLPIAFGEATKTVPFVFDGVKSYQFTVRWGVETNTHDMEGVVERESAERPTSIAIEAALGNFTGDIQQLPPRFSAIKIDGERAYARARDGQEFELEPRPVTIHELKIMDIPDRNHSILQATCGKGTYVRAIARDLGRKLGCFGHIHTLRRTRVGHFLEDASISLDKIEELGHSAAGREALMDLLLPVEAALDDIPALDLKQADAARLKRGQSVILRGRDAPIITGSVYAMSRGTLVALGFVQKGELRPVRVFNL